VEITHFAMLCLQDWVIFCAIIDCSSLIMGLSSEFMVYSLWQIVHHLHLFINSLVLIFF